MRNALLSLLTWAVAGLLTILMWLGSLFSAVLFKFFDPNRRSGHFVERCWAWANLTGNPFWNLTVERKARLDPSRTYIFVANHQSLADIIVLLRLNHTFKYVAKSDLFRVPFLGGTLRLNKHIKLERGSVRGTYAAMEEARKWIGRSMSVAFFAEGTRSLTGELAPFKRGAFKLAIETKTPIVPVAITGTREALPRGTWRFSHRVSGIMTVLPPIETSSYQAEDVDILRQRVFDEISRVFNSIEKETSAVQNQ
jgi:1-acyl-sn-glycerol-3-phosphate acyltransferase